MSAVDAQALYAEIAASKKYHYICEETLRRVCGEEAPKYRSAREAVKAAKARLHRISGAFIEERDLRQAQVLFAQSDKPIDAETARTLLRLHASSLERLPFLVEMFGDILRHTAPCERVLDIACGFNPLVLALLPDNGIAHYLATDIHTGCVELVNGFFAAHGISGEAVAGDILHTVPEAPVDVALLFKILPLLEQQRKGSALRVASALRARCLAVSFPTRSLSGRQVGMYTTYQRFMEETFFAEPAGYRCVLEKEYANELLFVVERAAGSTAVVR